ncbi:MAG: C4-type zinc ribbon domain-containing protein [Anaerolineales bacterium]|nr:C4-type zinc ribbon domain-containing protein [Anaerolineales bacterium]
MSQPFKLYRLQQLDSQLDRLQARLAEIRASLAEAEELQQAKSAAQQANEDLQAAQKALRKAEEAVKEQRIKIETTEAALYGGKVRNPKELQDLQHESAALKRFQSVLEDRQIEAMLNEEAAQEASQQAQIHLELVQAQHNARNANLLEEQERLLKEKPTLDTERQAATGSIPANEMAMYETLRKSRRGIAVSLVKNKACSACGTTLNAALLDAVITSGQLNRCDGCGRILYSG